MDFFAHILWAVAIFTIIGRKTGIKFNLKRAAFWGVFPDLFAFGLPVVWIIISFLLGTFDISILPAPEDMEPTIRDSVPVFRAASILYNTGHSLIIFAGAILMIILASRLADKTHIFSSKKLTAAVPKEMSAWLFHILLDIPSHSYKFFATPFLWPVSDFKIDGISWRTPWFFAFNYAAIGLVYIYIWRKNTNKRI